LVAQIAAETGLIDPLEKLRALQARTDRPQDLADRQRESDVVPVHLAVDHSSWQTEPKAGGSRFDQLPDDRRSFFSKDDHQPRAVLWAMFDEVADSPRLEIELRIQPIHSPICAWPAPYLTPLAQLIDDYALTRVLAVAACLGWYSAIEISTWS
jgi:hypothetical protein